MPKVTKYVGQVGQLPANIDDLPTPLSERKPAPMLFKLAVAADFAMCDAQRLRQWVHLGVIEPAVHGRQGRGRSNLFTPQQCMGILMTCWMWGDSWRGCRPAFIKESIDEYAAWPWSALEQALALRDDVWSEEALSKAFHPEPLPMEYKQPPKALSDYSEKELERLGKLVKRMTRLRDAIRERLGHKERVIPQTIKVKPKGFFGTKGR